MSYVNHLNAEEIRINDVEHDAVVNACIELQEIMGLNPVYDPQFDEKKTAEWLSEAVDELAISDNLSDETKTALKALGFKFPEDEGYTEEGEEDGIGSEEVDKAAEVSPEAEVDRKEDEQKPVKKAKAKKEPKPKKEKAPKEPKPKKEKAPKESKPVVPGVVETLRGFVREHGEAGFTMEQAHAFMCEKFPERIPANLLSTCRVQLQNSRMGKEIQYSFYAKKDPETKVRTIFAKPMMIGDAE